MYSISPGGHAPRPTPPTQRAFDAPRFRALVHHVAGAAGLPRSPVRTINLCWLCDFQAYLLLGDALTGASYVADPIDGVTVPLEQARAAFATDVASAIRLLGRSDRFDVRSPRFHRDEIRLVDEVIQTSRAWTTREIVERVTQQHPGLHLAAAAGAVPYEAVFVAATPGFEAAAPGALSDEPQWHHVRHTLGA